MTVTRRDLTNLGGPNSILDVAPTDDGTGLEDVLDVDEPWRYSPRQLKMAEETAELVAECGPFDQSPGPNGAHYMRENPFASDGIACASCVAYEGPRACEWVTGDIDPAGACKLWVIPADLITGAVPRSRALDVEARTINGRDREVRVIANGITVETRDATNGEDAAPVRFSGYAAVFNSPSERLWDRNHGEFTETIAPGAFKRTLARDADVRMYVNHNSDMVLASTRSGTLSLREDSKGLRVEAELPNTSYARDLVTLMRSGIVDSMSFGFTVIDDKWDGDQRELREVALSEVSLVSGHPAYPETAGASVRAVEPSTDPTDTLTTPARNAALVNLYGRKRG